MTIAPERGGTSRSRALALLGGAVAVGALIAFGAVLPAEYGIDPLGLGRATGIAKLWAPPQQTLTLSEQGASRSGRIAQSGRLRSDVVEIRLDTYESGNPSELEYKVHLRKGATLSYSWDVAGQLAPQDFYSDFHGHTVVDGKAATVADYRKSDTPHDSGTLVAPFDGVHGWYFQNSAANPVTVRLRLSGFYNLVPAGQPGNEAGIIAQPLK